MEKVNELVEKLVKEYNLDKTDETFIQWYVSLSREEKDKIFPIILSSALQCATEFLKSK